MFSFYCNRNFCWCAPSGVHVRLHEPAPRELKARKILSKIKSKRNLKTRKLYVWLKMHRRIFEKVELAYNWRHEPNVGFIWTITVFWLYYISEPVWMMNTAGSSFAYTFWSNSIRRSFKPGLGPDSHIIVQVSSVTSLSFSFLFFLLWVDRENIEGFKHLKQKIPYIKLMYSSTEWVGLQI